MFADSFFSLHYLKQNGHIFSFFPELPHVPGLASPMFTLRTESHSVDRKAHVSWPVILKVKMQGLLTTVRSKHSVNTFYPVDHEIGTNSCVSGHFRHAHFDRGAP